LRNLRTHIYLLTTLCALGIYMHPASTYAALIPVQSVLADIAGRLTASNLAEPAAMAVLGAVLVGLGMAYRRPGPRA